MKREADGGGDFELVITTVKRCRARLRLVACVRSGCAASLIAVLAVEILVALGAHVHVSTIAGAATLLLAVAAMIGFAQTPTPAEAAARLDRHLRLRNVVDTAFACAADRDAMAMLVAREAASRVRDVRPATLFPFELSRAVYALVAATVIVPIAMALTTGGLRRAFDPARSTDAAGPGGLNIAAAGKLAQAGSARAVAALDAAATPSIEAATASAVPAVSPAPERTAGRDLNVRATADRKLDGRSTDRGDGGGSANAAAGNGGGGAVEGRTVGGTSSRQQDAAGGVTGASLTPAVPPARQSAPWQSNDRYRAAWLKTQTAVAQERVPMLRRAYVRRYFTAIRPEDHQ